MNYKEPLTEAKIINTFQKCILDVQLQDGAFSHAFCPEVDFNQQLYPIGAKVYLTKSADKRRKVPYICQMSDSGAGLIFVNYKYKNQLFKEAFLMVFWILTLDNMLICAKLKTVMCLK